MGAYCSSGDSNVLSAYGEFKVPLSVAKLVRLQAAARGLIARQRLRSVKTSKVRSIMSISTIHSHNLNRGFRLRHNKVVFAVDYTGDRQGD